MNNPLRDDGGNLPLELYAALGDGRSVAVVGGDGSVDWWGQPTLASEPLFDRLLDPERGGRFSITPDQPYTVERSYRPDSNVLEQTFTTASGRARITDSLNSGISGRLPWSELGRRVEGLDGSVVFTIEMRPSRRRDQASAWRESTIHGDVIHIDGLLVALRHDGAVQRLVETDDRLVARVTASAGSRHTVAVLVSADEPLILPPVATVDARIDRSDQAWREWCRNLVVEGAFEADVRRSALALKLLLFSPSGAIAAAATTSLPERAGGGRNYDYRFAWTRDIAFTINAFLRVGAVEEAKAAFSWLMASIRRHGGYPCIMYQIDGSLAPAEHEVDLPGYAGSKPVRFGNKARSQLQLGIFGDILQTAALFVKCGHVLDQRTRRDLALLADRCADTWRNADSGIWELDEAQQYTISKFGCWVALDRAVTLADSGQIEAANASRWGRERDRIVDWIERECWSEHEQAYTFYPGTRQLDASLLLATRFGYPRSDRLAATRDAIVRRLTRGALVYRFTGAETIEATFTACGFWLVEAYALLGNQAEAREQMRGMLQVCNANLGLMTEEIDAASGRFLGNLPQALSHLALIHAANALNER